MMNNTATGRLGVSSMWMIGAASASLDTQDHSAKELLSPTATNEVLRKHDQVPRFYLADGHNWTARIPGQHFPVRAVKAFLLRLGTPYYGVAHRH